MKVSLWNLYILAVLIYSLAVSTQQMNKIKIGKKHIHFNIIVYYYTFIIGLHYLIENINVSTINK